MSFTPSENPITHPTRQNWTDLRPFRFWCQKVLPLVYDDSLSYYELLCKVVDYLNKTMEDVENMNTDVGNLYDNFQQFQEGTIRIYNELVAFVNDYFDNLSVQDEINNKLDEMATDGTLSTLISPLIPDLVADWLDEHITPTSPAIDSSLNVSGAGADAKVTGDYIRALNVPYADNIISSDNLINGVFDREGTVVPSTTRIRTNNFIKVKKGTKITFKKGDIIKNIYFGLFNSITGIHESDDGWHDDGYSYTFNEDKILIIMFKHDNETSISPSDYDAITTIKTIEEQNDDKRKDDISINEFAIKIQEQGKTIINKTNILQNIFDRSMEKVYHRYRICTIPIHVSVGMDITIIPSTNCQKFLLSYFNENKTWINDSEWKTETYRYKLDYNGYLVILFAKNNDSEITVNEYDANVTIYSNTYKPTFENCYGYITDGKSIIFKNKNLFDAEGRCAWRFTGAWIAFYSNETGVVGINFDSLINILSASDDVLIENNQTWAYLHAERGIFYDAEKREFVVHIINNRVDKERYKYLMISFTYNKFLDGMLKPQFMFDAVNYKISDIESSDVRSIKNSEVKNYVLNARHIKYNRAVPLTLLHISDVHGDALALQRIINDTENFEGLVDDMICTGDMVDVSSTISSWWDERIMTCIGNHDSATRTDDTWNWTALSMANRDAYYISPFESNWGIEHTPNTSYYYKDYTANNIRLIVLDVMLYMSNDTTDATAQSNWLRNVLNSAITNNYHTLIALHSPHDGATAKECSFSRLNQSAMPLWTDCNTPQSVIDIVADAITNGLIFIGYICGHTHQDNIWDAENNGKQLMYCVTCAVDDNRNDQWYFSDQNRGITQDAYNIVTIDTDNKLVKIVRGGGADSDDHMRTRKAICISYETGTVLSEVL